MQSIEFQGKTAEEAIENACRGLNLSRDELDIKIIEPGSPGIFGLVGGRKALIEAIIKTEGTEEPDDEKNGLGLAKETLEEILALIPMEGVVVSAAQSDGIIALSIEGDESGLLIGRKGRTLDALQFIVSKIVNKALEKRTQVVVDSENYRQRRLDFLSQMALKIGDKTKKTGKPMATNLLNSHDRRIVHLALRNDENLETKSRGDGILKKVVIIPKR